MVSLTDGHTFSEEKDVLRNRRPVPSKQDSSFSLRSPLTRNHKEWEQSPPLGTRSGNHHRGNFRYKQADERKPTLAHFAPNLVTRLGGSPHANRGVSAPHADRASSAAERHRKGWSEPKERSFSQRHPSKAKGSQHYSCRKDENRGARSFSSGPKTRVRPSPQSLQAEEKTCDAKDSRVRKCLWADEVDEAFVDEDGSSGDCAQLDELDDSPRKPLTEQQLARRQKDIDYGKSTSGYTNYLQKIKREDRSKKCPQTPDKTANHSRRKWDYLVHKWRRDLHNFDDPSEENSDATKDNTPSKASLCDGDTEKRAVSPRSGSLPSSVTSTPSDQGYATTPDSKANLSFEQTNGHSLLPGEDADHFPPLTTSSETSTPAKAVWVKPVENSEDSILRNGGESMDTEGLKEFAEKLIITGEKSGDDDQMQE